MGLAQSSACSGHTGQASIVGLSLLGGPFAIGRFVRAVVVDAVQGVLWRRPLAQVAKERGEVTLPFVTHPNPATAIVGILVIRRIVTAAAHIQPRLVLWRVASAVRQAQRVLRQFARPSTTATPRMSGPQLSNSDNRPGATHAQALVKAIAPIAMIETFHDQVSITIPDFIARLWPHCLMITLTGVE